MGVGEAPGGDDTDPPTATQRRWWSSPVVRATVGVAAGGIAAVAVVSTAGGLGDAARAVRHVRAAWLVPAVAFEVVAYVLSAIRLRRLAGADAVLGLADAVGVNLVVNGLGLLTPAAPAEGIAFEYAALRRRGLSRRHATMTMGFEQWFSTRVVFLVQAVNLVVVVSWRDLPTNTDWVLALAVVLLAVLAVTAVLANRVATAERLMVAVGALRFWRPRTPVDERRSRGAEFHRDAMAMVGPPRRRVALMGLSVASLLADAACMWMAMFAGGLHHGFEIAVLAVGAGMAGAIVPFVPGGLGVVEAIIPAVLAWYGTPVSQGLAVALVYRTVGTFLPAAGGAVALPFVRPRRLRGREPGETDGQPVAT